MIACVDFETYYDKDCSIKTLGPRGYFAHPDFEAYLVAVYSDDETIRYSEDPRRFDWSLLEGATLVSHNAAFDQGLYLYGVEQGWWPWVDYAEWHCTSDMGSYLGYPAALAGACKEILGLEKSKLTREEMKGKRFRDLSPEARQDVIEYALDDARLGLMLWQAKAHEWPDWEKEVSLVNRRAVLSGLPINERKLREGVGILRTRLFDAERAIPWIEEKPPLSRPAFNAECRKEGIDPPKSLAIGDEQADQFVDTYADKFEWIRSVRDWRRINMLISKLESFQASSMSDGRYYGNIQYFGAYPTGRFSGRGGNLNLQNLPREELYGVQLRPMIETPPDTELAVVDLSQIEARTLLWLAGDEASLNIIRNSRDFYEGMAVIFGLWEFQEDLPLKQTNPGIRKLSKTLALGCGYQAGGPKIASVSDLTLEEAEAGVNRYRSSLPKVPELWERYKNYLTFCWKKGKTMRLTLPSGRVLSYPDLWRDSGPNGFPEYYTRLRRNGKLIPVKLYGGKITENMSQALARDIFCDRMVAVARAGHKIVLHVHDELVVESPKSESRDRLADIVRILTTPPDWIPDIPLAAEGETMTCYEK